MEMILLSTLKCMFWYCLIAMAVMWLILCTPIGTKTGIVAKEPPCERDADGKEWKP